MALLDAIYQPIFAACFSERSEKKKQQHTFYDLLIKSIN